MLILSPKSAKRPVDLTGLARGRVFSAYTSTSRTCCSRLAKLLYLIALNEEDAYLIIGSFLARTHARLDRPSEMIYRRPAPIATEEFSAGRADRNLGASYLLLCVSRGAHQDTITRAAERE